MSVRIGVVVFPGSNRDIDAVNALTVAGAEPVILWHEQADLDGVAAILLPGGFAYGDYLRAGVIAQFSPVMRSVADFAGARRARARRVQRVPGPRGGRPRAGGPAAQPGPALRLPPGGAPRGAARHAVHARARGAGPLRMPVAHGEGCYFADDATLDALEADGQVLWRYVGADGDVALPDDPGNPNGSLRGIAGVSNAAGNVAGLMPHPETRRRGDPGLGRRPGDHPLARRQRAGVRLHGRARRRGADPGGRRVTVEATLPAPPLHRALGLADVELDAIRAKLGRDPNDLELAMFSVMWSEHCSYKSSRPLLGTLPTKGEGVVAGIGEQAGVISIGDGLAVAFKIESHNHPSAVEPYQGAATGVGGILRDMFAMGARPIAVLDALRFGNPSDARTRLLVDGVVRGVGGYGNCVGVPTVGGELVFDPSYQGNPLVNVMAIGLLEERDAHPRLRRRARATSWCCTAPRRAATGSAGRPCSRPRRSGTRTRRSARASRSATRSRRSC